MARTQEQKVADLMNRVQAAETYRSPYERDWQLCRDVYRGRARSLVYSSVEPHYSAHPDEHLYGMNAEVPEVKALVDTIYTMSSVNMPKISVLPRAPENTERAKAVEAVANFWWRAWGAHLAFQLALKDSIVVGHGWVKCHWRLQEKTEPYNEEEIARFFDHSLAIRQEQLERNPDAASELPSEEELREIVESRMKSEPKVLLHSEYPQATHVSPWDMFVDPQASHFEEARWVCQRFWRPLEEAKKDKDYKRGARSELTSTTQNLVRSYDGRQGFMERNTQNIVNPADELVMLYEFHDLAEGTWCVFAAEGNKFLIEPRESPFVGTPYRSPFEQIRNYETGDLFPQGDVIQLIPLLWELNETRTQMMLNRRQQNPKYVVDQQFFTDGVEAALSSNRPGEIVKLPLRANRRLDDAIQALPQPNTIIDLAGATSVIRDDMERTSGIGPLARGTAEVERRSAAEAQILQGASAGRAADKMMKAQYAASRIAGRMVLLAQKLLSQGDVARIVGIDGSVSWVQYDREKLQGVYDFEVEAGSMAPRDEASKRQDALVLKETFSNPLFAQVVNPYKLAELFFVTWGVDNAKEYLVSQGLSPGVPGGILPLQQSVEGAFEGSPETANQVLDPLQQEAARTQEPLP